MAINALVTRQRQKQSLNSSGQRLISGPIPFCFQTNLIMHTTIAQFLDLRSASRAYCQLGLPISWTALWILHVRLHLSHAYAAAADQINRSAAGVAAAERDAVAACCFDAFPTSLNL
jgi:hypothetical protein